MIKVYRRFGETYCLNLQGRYKKYVSQKHVNVYQTTRRHALEDSNLYSHRHENRENIKPLKTHEDYCLIAAGIYLNVLKLNYSISSMSEISLRIRRTLSRKPY
jgi:hypothetical protein